MKNKPIENPKFIGCLNCRPIPKKRLPKNYRIYEGFDMTYLSLNDKFVDIPKHHHKESGMNFYRLKEITEIVKKSINLTSALLTHSTPLHEETYEYSKIDGYWYLVKQGLGFA